MEPDKSRKLIYIWASSFEQLKAISDAAGKPMTEIFDEAVRLVATRYLAAEPTLKEEL